MRSDREPGEGFDRRLADRSISLLPYKHYKYTLNVIIIVYSNCALHIIQFTLCSLDYKFSVFLTNREVIKFASSIGFNVIKTMRGVRSKISYTSTHRLFNTNTHTPTYRCTHTYRINKYIKINVHACVHNGHTAPSRGSSYCNDSRIINKYSRCAERRRSARLGRFSRVSVAVYLKARRRLGVRALLQSPGILTTRGDRAVRSSGAGLARSNRRAAIGHDISALPNDRRLGETRPRGREIESHRVDPRLGLLLSGADAKPCRGSRLFGDREDGGGGGG